MNKYYISFAGDDKEGFLGACVVDAQSEALAILEAHLHGCNPGGEALIIEVPLEVYNEKPLPMNTLLSMDQLLMSGDVVDLDGNSIQETVQ